MVAHRVARATGVAAVGGAGVTPPPVVGGVDGVGGVGAIEAVLGVAVDVAVVDDQVGGGGVVSAHLVLGKDRVLQEGAGVLHVEPPVLATHNDQVAQRRGAAVQVESAGGTVAPPVTHRHVV